MDEFDRMFFEYVAIVAAPSLGAPLDILIVSLLIAGLALAAAALVLWMPTGQLQASAVAQRQHVAARFEHHWLREVHGLGRARAPSPSDVVRI